MADLFISYSREDAQRAQALAAALESEGFDVFWDREIPPGHTWAEFLETKLNDCKRVLVLWSGASTQSQWVREEARMGRDRGKLVPVMLDASAPPFGFGEVQAANLADWNGRRDHAGFQRLVAALRTATGAPQPQAAPQPHFTGSSNTFASGPAAPSFDPSPSAAGSPVDYIQKCLRMYANGNGRARRSEFWWFALFQFGVGVVAGIADAVFFGYGQGGVAALTLITALGLLAPGVSVMARRFHDVGLNGWLVAAGYAGILLYGLGAIFLLVVALIPGQPKPNQYGPDPKAA